MFRIPLAILFSAGLGWDVVWVWYALIFDHAARAIWLLISFRRGKWLTRLQTTD